VILHHTARLNYGAIRCKATIAPCRVKEVDEQVAVFLQAEQGFEYAIYFRVYVVFHGKLL